MNKHYDIEPIVNGFRLRDGVRAYAGSLSAVTVSEFQKIIYDYYEVHKRDFPWRRTSDPYHIVVSEVMLQQTQTDRVIDKFTEFISKFPTVQSLASAEQGEVLAAWQGLGYNRRGLMLYRLAQKVVEDFDGLVPDEPDELIKLPGIGPATSASIAVFAFNRPEVFIETNIRTLFIHFFFYSEEAVTDDRLMPLIEQTLDKKQPYHWYSALMDYGSMLKKQYPNPGRKSAHYQRQSTFKGSRRQTRGKILRLLLEENGMTLKKICTETVGEPDYVSSVLDDLLKEGMVRKEGKRFYV